MRKTILLLVAMAMCVLFATCTKKVRVVIPDGLYEETAHFVRYDVYGSDPNDKAEYLAIDTVFTTQVLIDQGEFIYLDMCSDTICRQYSNGEIEVRYRSHFIYAADAYCPEIIYQDGEFHQDGSVGTMPIRVSSDGFVIISRPYFMDAWLALKIPRDYTSRAPVINNTGVFRFEQNHEFVHRSSNYNTYKYRVTHTLRAL